MDGSIHGGDGSEVDHLHLTLEVGVADNLARCGRVHAQHLAISQIQHIAAIQLRSHAVGCQLLAPLQMSLFPLFLMCGHYQRRLWGPKGCTQCGSIGVRADV